MGEIISFFIPLKKIPTTTKQQQKFHVVDDSQGNRKVQVYKGKWSESEKTIDDGLSKFDCLMPKQCVKVLGKKGVQWIRGLNGAVRMKCIWCFPKGKKHDNQAGMPKVTKPDLDNLNKGLQDVMASRGWFAQGDQQIADLHIQKMYSSKVGIYVELEQLEESN